MNQKKTVFTFLLVLLAVCLAATDYPMGGRAGAAAQRAHVVILGTTDMHGRVFPIDYYEQVRQRRHRESRDAGKGSAQERSRSVAGGFGARSETTLIKEARKNDPDLLLVDSGDTIQGTPLEYFHNKKNNAPPDPMMLAMNALHYDSMAVGNHEYNFGLKVLEKARSEAKFPWLSANTYNKGTLTTHYQPYIVKEVQGVRIGVLGD